MSADNEAGDPVGIGDRFAELLDRTVIWNQHHLLQVLREFGTRLIDGMPPAQRNHRGSTGIDTPQATAVPRDHTDD